MPWLYILENKSRRHYIGITELEPEARLKRHNRGDVQSTKWDKPWFLVHKEKHKDMNSARVKEKQIKSWHGGNAFKKFLLTAAGSSNGRTSPFGGEYLGSNPSPAAVRRNNRYDFGGVK